LKGGEGVIKNKRKKKKESFCKKKMRGAIVEVLIYVFVLIPAFLLITLLGAVQQNYPKI
jgi:uncharacterized protein YqgC (DUF456 family)